MFTVELKDSSVPYIMKKPQKYFHKFLFFLKILNDSLILVFSCSAPIDGGLGGSFLMNKKIITKAIADARNSPAYK